MGKVTEDPIVTALDGSFSVVLIIFIPSARSDGYSILKVIMQLKRENTNTLVLIQMFKGEISRKGWGAEDGAVV